MDFTVYKVTPMGGPGGKRIMNLNLLLSTNSQNRNLQSFFAKTLNRIELPTVDPGWSCRQGSGLLLLTADVEKIAELAWFQVVLFKPLWCVRQTEDDSFPYSFRKIYCYRKPGSEIRKALFEICPATGSLVPRLDILVQIYVLPMPIDFTAYKTKLYYFKLWLLASRWTILIN